MGGSQLDPALGGPCRSLLSRFSYGATNSSGLSFWTFFNHNYVLHSRAISVGGCRVSLPDRQAASSPRDPVSWLGPLCIQRITRHRGLYQTYEAHWAPAQLSGPWFCSCWPEVPFFPCWSSRGSASVLIPPAIQWWRPGHLSRVFPRDILYEALGRGLPETLKPWWTPTFGVSVIIYDYMYVMMSEHHFDNDLRMYIVFIIA